MLIQTLRITACFAVLAHAALPAQQMSGAYTIDPNRVGNRNFKSFTAASFQLGTRGVSGAVTLTAANGQYFSRGSSARFRVRPRRTWSPSRARLRSAPS